MHSGFTFSAAAAGGADRQLEAMNLMYALHALRIALEGVAIGKPRRRRIPHHGVYVRATDVRRHRYLRDHGLQHSATVADVYIG